MNTPLPKEAVIYLRDHADELSEKELLTGALALAQMKKDAGWVNVTPNPVPMFVAMDAERVLEKVYGITEVAPSTNGDEMPQPFKGLTDAALSAIRVAIAAESGEPPEDEHIALLESLEAAQSQFFLARESNPENDVLFRDAAIDLENMIFDCHEDKYLDIMKQFLLSSPLRDTLALGRDTKAIDPMTYTKVILGFGSFKDSV